jgi:hypothetical protein
MNYKNKIVLGLTLFLGSSVSFAQSDISTTGGDAAGAGGSASYTVGQLNYETYFGSNGSVALGVQQPYEISVVGIQEVGGIALGLNVYPNPTTDYLTLNVEHYLDDNLTYTLYDLNGKVLASNHVSGNLTTIEMSNYDPATYFIKIEQNSTQVKTFKIIKNQ